MCLDGYWGSVCNDYADFDVALVACYELGFFNIVRGTKF